MPARVSGLRAARQRRRQALAGSGEAPTITGFEISEQLLGKKRPRVSFANFTSASLEGNVLVDDKHGIVALGDKNWVSYGPSVMEIGDLVELSADIPSQRGPLLVQRGYGHEIVGTTIYQPYYWSDATFQVYSQESQIAVFERDDIQVHERDGRALSAPAHHDRRRRRQPLLQQWRRQHRFCRARRHAAAQLHGAREEGRQGD